MLHFNLKVVCLKKNYKIQLIMVKSYKHVFLKFKFDFIKLNDNFFVKENNVFGKCICLNFRFTICKYDSVVLPQRLLELLENRATRRETYAL